MSERLRPNPSPSTDRGETTELAIADCVRGILATKNLTLYKISRWTRTNYPTQPSFHIPRNLYFQLRSGVWSPRIEQLAALSRLTGYRLIDWLAVFGFHLDDISRLQICIEQPRTALLDSSIYDRHVRTTWFQDRTSIAATPPIAPLGQLLAFADPEPIAALASKGPSPYVYAKIGRRDAYAFPDLAPGSIVRADSRLTARSARNWDTEISEPIFLVEHSHGFTCCRLHFGSKHRITLAAAELPFANVELQLGSEAKILGIVDMELRPLYGPKHPANLQCTPPEVAPDLTRLWTPAPLDRRLTHDEPAQLIRSARRRAGLSFREATEMSREVAHTLQDKRYFASPGSLSEYEATNTPPRHIHKLLTLCVLYSIRFGDLLHWFGLEEDHMAAIPREWMLRNIKFPREARMAIPAGKSSSTGFLASLLDRLGEVPFFLRQSFPFLSGLPNISLRDVFWVGGQQRAMQPPWLDGALFVVVDRRKRRPSIFPRKPAWEQPIYLLRKRDESYLITGCRIENGTIVLHSYTDKFVPPQRFENSVDAEVVGQIVTVVRSLLSPP